MAYNVHIPFNFSKLWRGQLSRRYVNDSSKISPKIVDGEPEESCEASAGTTRNAAAAMAAIATRTMVLNMIGMCCKKWVGGRQKERERERERERQTETERERERVRGRESDRKTERERETV